MNTEIPFNVSVLTILDKFRDSILVVSGRQDFNINNVCSFNNPVNNSLIWIGKGFFLTEVSKIRTLKNCLIITDWDAETYGFESLCIIKTQKPKHLFISLLNFLFPSKNSGVIHATAVIDSNAKIGKNVSIGSNCSIGKVNIGDGTIIESNVTIYDNVVIGKNVKIQAGAVIGSAGMSLSRGENNEFIGFPCLGKVIIEDDVEIGSNSVIDQSIIEETRIGKGTKINSLTFIGNSVVIGRNNYISVVVNINGSVRVGDNNFIGSGSTIRNKLTVGDNNTVGAGSVVIKNVGNNETIVGNPGKSRDEVKGIKL
jgi:UDP-3-O-[3-hydroxymyristoyl] glucosamine N-acyltransferase LpxD